MVQCARAAGSLASSWAFHSEKELNGPAPRPALPGRGPEGPRPARQVAKDEDPYQEGRGGVGGRPRGDLGDGEALEEQPRQLHLEDPEERHQRRGVSEAGLRPGAPA